MSSGSIDIEEFENTDVDDIETTLSTLSTARAATDRFGPEDPDEWGPGVDADRKNK